MTREEEKPMKLTMTVAFDPIEVSAKDIQAALVTAGINPDDIKIGTTRAPKGATPKPAKG